MTNISEVVQFQRASVVRSKHTLNDTHYNGRCIVALRWADQAYLQSTTLNSGP